MSEYRNPITIVTTAFCAEEKVRTLKPPMPFHSEAKRQAADDNCLTERSSRHILNNIWPSSRLQYSPRCSHQIGMIPISVDIVRDGIALTRRTGVNDIVICTESCAEFQRVRLHKFKRIARLGIDIHAHNSEARTAITDCCTTCATEQI